MAKAYHSSWDGFSEFGVVGMVLSPFLIFYPFRHLTPPKLLGEGVN